MILISIDKIKKYLPVNKSIDIEKLQPFITESEKELKEYIGEALYKKLSDYAESELEDNSFYSEAIALLENSLSNLAFFKGFDILNTVFSNQGFHRIEKDNGDKKALFQRQEINLRNTFRQQGYSKLDDALRYMAENKDEFDNFSLENKYIINTAQTFDEIFFINKSIIVFTQLKRGMQLAEDFDIKPLLGAAFYSEIKEQIKNGSLTDANSIFLVELRKAVAYMTIARSANVIGVHFDNLGITNYSIESGSSNTLKKQPLENESLDRLIEFARDTGKSYLQSCISFLKENIDDYPLFSESDVSNIYDLDSTDKIVVM